MATTAIVPTRQTSTRRASWLAPASLLAAPLAWMSFFYLIPLGLLLVHAFWSVDYLTIDRTLTLDNLRTIASNPLYPTVLARTAMIAAAVTLTDIVLAFPIAYYIAKRATKHRDLLLMLVVFPLWSSYLVRAFASIEDRARQEHDFYGSDAWRQGPREAIVSRIVDFHTIVLDLPDAVASAWSKEMHAP